MSYDDVRAKLVTLRLKEKEEEALLHTKAAPPDSVDAEILAHDLKRGGVDAATDPMDPPFIARGTQTDEADTVDRASQTDNDDAEERAL